MKRLISILLTVALSALCPCMGSAEGQGDVDQIIAHMSLRDKLAQMIVISPRFRREETASDGDPQSVTALNDEMRDYISKNHFGGVVLFSENCQSAEQLLRLTRDLRSTMGDIQPLIAVDQEGGIITRIGFGTSGIGNMALAATNDPSNARDMAAIYGQELKLLGIDVDFAPVMDVNDNAANPVIGVRSFGDDPRTVTEFGLAYIDGLLNTGTISCVKHFPGHGNTGTDSHTGLPLVDRGLDELRSNELVPFRAAVDAGVDMVMTAHIQYPQVESGTYTSASSGEEIYLPATMSKTILTDLLRDEMGFEGVIVSDALDMDAIWENFTLRDMLALCINAGVDMLLMPCNDPTDIWTVPVEMLDYALALVEEGTIDVETIDTAVRRILTLKQKYGLLEEVDSQVTEEMIASAAQGCGSAAHRQAAWRMAERALTLLKNENNAFPLELQPDERTLILFTAESRLGAGDLARQLLEQQDMLPKGATIECMVIDPDTAGQCIEAARAADHVLFVSRAWAVDCLDPGTENGYPTGVVNEIIEALHGAGRTAVVISAQLPYDAACYPEADAILLAYGSGAMKSAPDISGSWAPNLPSAICAAFGMGTPLGQLPVNLPALDDEYKLTGDILYPRQVTTE